MSCRDADWEGSLGRHVVAVVEVRVLEAVRVAIKAGLLARPRAEAARSGLDVRSIVMVLICFDRMDCVQRIEFRICSRRPTKTCSTCELGTRPLYQFI